MNKVRCPICDRGMDGQGPREWPDWPFCSPRCKLIDLGRWLGEEYRLGTDPEEEDEFKKTADPRSAEEDADF